MDARRAGLGVLVATLLAVACTTDSPTAPTADQLAGAWRLVALRPAGSQSDVPAPSNANYTVTFTDGRVSVRADCNICNGVFSLNGQTLTAGPTLICTRAACPTMTFENTYTLLIAGDSTVSLNGNQLVLTSSRGILRFTR
jgi:heat shock protein HslJ